MKSLATHLMFGLIALAVLLVGTAQDAPAASGGGGATLSVPTMPVNLAAAATEAVYSETHQVAPNSPYAAQVSVESAHTYLVEFAAPADGSVMAGEVMMMQDADPQATVELAEYTAVPKDSGSFEFYAPSNPTGPTADLILSASQGSGSVHVTVQDITPEDLMIYDEAEDNSVFVHSATHHVTENAPYIAEVPVKPGYVYDVYFSCTADPQSNDPVNENVMVGQHARCRIGMMQTLLRGPGFRRKERRIRQQAVEALSFSARDWWAIGWTNWPTASPMPTVAAWRSRGQWPPSHGCSCWTSRRQA